MVILTLLCCYWQVTIIFCTLSCQHCTNMLEEFRMLTCTLTWRLSTIGGSVSRLPSFLCQNSHPTLSRPLVGLSGLELGGGPPSGLHRLRSRIGCVRISRVSNVWTRISKTGGHSGRAHSDTEVGRKFYNRREEMECVPTSARPPHSFTFSVAIWVKVGLLDFLCAHLRIYQFFLVHIFLAQAGLNRPID